VFSQDVSALMPSAPLHFTTNSMLHNPASFVDEFCTQLANWSRSKQLRSVRQQIAREATFGEANALTQSAKRENAKRKKLITGGTP
jgi:hypothetical protein